MIKKSAILFLLFSLFLIPIKAEARTLNDIYGELNNLQDEIDANKIEQDATNSEIAQKETEINNLYFQIGEAEADIEEAEAKIDELNVEIEQKRIETENILKYYQTSGSETDYLDYIFGAQTLTDFIHRVVVAEEVSSYNKKMIKEMEDLVVEQQELKEELEDKKASLKAQQETARIKVEALSAVASDLEDEHISLADEINITKEMIALYESLGTCDSDDDLEVCANSVIPPDTKFWRPLDSGIISSPWGYRVHPVWGYTSMHNGIDIGGGYIGKPIYAAAAGKVSYIRRVPSGAPANSYCGGQYIFINHNIDGKAYTTAYLHVHDIYVSEGDIVTKNTVIGTMGGGEAYDSCTTGAHLHFSLMKGITASTSNSLNPVDYVNIPTSGWFRDRTTKY